MVFCIFRVDDVNATTNVKWLERLYNPLVEIGIPINYAVVPRVYCASIVPGNHPLKLKYQLIYQPYIHHHVGQKIYLDLCSNTELTLYLSSSSFEILQHGFAHERINAKPEFEIEDRKELIKRIIEGGNIIALGVGYKPKFFVAPHERMSREAFEIIAQAFLGTFVWSLPWRLSYKILPRRYLAEFLTDKVKMKSYFIFDKRFLVLETKGVYLLLYYPNFLKKITSLINRTEVLVIVDHYWQYLINPKFLRFRDTILNILLKLKDIKFLSCYSLYRKLLK